MCVLALTIQTLVNNKYMGHFVMVLYYLLISFGSQLSAGSMCPHTLVE